MKQERKKSRERDHDRRVELLEKEREKDRQGRLNRRRSRSREPARVVEGREPEAIDLTFSPPAQPQPLPSVQSPLPAPPVNARLPVYAQPPVGYSGASAAQLHAAQRQQQAQYPPYPQPQFYQQSGYQQPQRQYQQQSRIAQQLQQWTPAAATEPSQPPLSAFPPSSHPPGLPAGQQQWQNILSNFASQPPQPSPAFPPSQPFYSPLQEQQQQQPPLYHPQPQLPGYPPPGYPTAAFGAQGYSSYSQLHSNSSPHLYQSSL